MRSKAKTRQRYPLEEDIRKDLLHALEITPVKMIARKTTIEKIFLLMNAHVKDKKRKIYYFFTRILKRTEKYENIEEDNIVFLGIVKPDAAKDPRIKIIDGVPYPSSNLEGLL